MVVQHNMTAMNANRMLGVTTSSQAKTTEKLSSGYKINRAADDAAGLSISEKMRKQIKGLTQATNNAQDGVSAVQTAEGALTEVHDMLQRMNQLATQAANGTNSDSDRQSIQNEISQLTTEIDRVAETTKFNETYLLKGVAGTKDVYMKGHDAGLKGELADSATTAEFKMKLAEDSNVTIGGKDYTIYNADGEISKMQKAIKDLDETAGKKVSINGVDYTVVESANVNAAENKLEASTLAGMIKDGDRVKVDVDDDAAKEHIVADTTLSKNITQNRAVQLATDELTAANKIGVTSTVQTVSVTPDTPAADGTTTFSINKGAAKTAKELSFSLHVGADADMTNKITVNIETMNSDYLGVKGLSVADSTGKSATYAIDAIADAIQKVSDQRSALGAVQNRLEHTIKNLDNVVENTTAAESQIRDTDMASTMVEYTKNNILAQAGQSMLAQANQSTQGVLSLLG